MRSENTFLDKNIEIEEILRGMLSAGRGEKAVAVEQITGGANSIAYKIYTEHNRKYLAKKYLIREGDVRDRLATEFFGISFLWDNDVRNIPEPICCNREHQIGIYSFINGEKLKPEEITLNDIHMASDFLRRLHLLVSIENADKQPVASEACFSIRAYVDCVEGRLSNLRNITVQNELYEMLSEYLDKDFAELFKEVKEFIKEQALRLNIDINRELSREEKTLSPSDFGFHNAIKADDGKLYFIDFEYYGWDDPAKMISDFYLQPAVPVPYSYREIFLKEIQRCKLINNELEKRLPSVYILLALKWCLIMLNVFLVFAHGRKYNEAVCLQQLEKAKNKLKEARHEFEVRAFPLSLN